MLCRKKNTIRYKQLIEDAKMILKGFQLWYVKLTKKKKANMTAHRLTKTAIQPSRKMGYPYP